MQIRSICNLATLECYYHNVAKSIKPADSGLAHIGEVDRVFWIEYTGVAKIGIDMSKVDMKIEDDCITIYIPEAKLLSISIRQEDLNEDSYITSNESWFNKNKITAEDQTTAINEAQEKMEESVKNNTALLMKAQNRAKELIENYIVQMGEITGVQYKIQWTYEKDTVDKQDKE
jgi:sorbitol-specific phosphotransferase system component IIBC